MFAVRITPAIKHRTLDLKLTTQRRHTLPVQYPARYCNPIFHPENSGTCHPNLRSMQLSLFSSVSSLGSTPNCLEVDRHRPPPGRKKPQAAQENRPQRLIGKHIRTLR